MPDIYPQFSKNGATRDLKIERETVLKIGIQPSVEIAFWKRESISLNRRRGRRSQLYKLYQEVLLPFELSMASFLSEFTNYVLSGHVSVVNMFMVLYCVLIG